MMSRCRVRFVGLVISVLTVGCQSEPSPEVEEPKTPTEAVVQDLFDQQAREGVVAERAVYPHHFVANEATLNGLGERHVAMLATGLKNNPGKIAIPQGNASADLHKARVKSVLEALEAAGVDATKIDPSANLPGGPGITSERAATAYVGNADETTQGNTGSSQGFGTQGSSSGQRSEGR